MKLLKPGFIQVLNFCIELFYDQSDKLISLIGRKQRKLSLRMAGGLVLILVCR